MKAPFYNGVSLPAAFTTALWTSCLAIGVIGVIIPYHRDPPFKPGPPPVQAQILQVQLTDAPLPVPDQAPPPPDISTPPPPLQSLPLPSAPALTPVAAPNPAIAFELPVPGPTRIVEAKQAAYSAPAQKPVAATPTAPPVKEIVFGRGEGFQRAPTYPPRALALGQEGTVRVQFVVGTDGRTVAAELAVRSPWPLLNEAALKVIREHWRFNPGPIRQFEVPIHFKIRK